MGSMNPDPTTKKLPKPTLLSSQNFRAASILGVARSHVPKPTDALLAANACRSRIPFKVLKKRLDFLDQQSGIAAE
ncbi:MAG: hypothetical protein ACI89E_000296 [Planctomycetota bacterium]|jgi:hypothetical protein